ncbi:MAG: DUF2500 domain-containing protein [Clostridiaceae bacterium]|nr:DUF2500 domain-containing protein [Clostridiaceae bacterium]
MFELLFGGIFLIVFGMIISQMVRGVAEWNRNNHAPVERQRARVAGKREEVHHHTHTDGNGMMHTTTSVTYYATFELAQEQRMELRIQGSVYGALKQGDCGTLIFQGTRYLNFERE